MTHEATIEQYLGNCLYFAAGTLQRAISRLADEAFAGTGLSPSHAFLMMLVNESPGATMKELTQALHLAPSTVTRFVDSLERKEFVRRESEGKLTHVHPTEQGAALREPIAKSWHALYVRYSDILGEAAGKELTATIAAAGAKLEE